jgi:hypothetical protein
MPPRQLRNPPNPVDHALLLTLLERYSSNALGKTALDDTIARTIGDVPNARELAGRLIHSFRQIPLSRRTAAFGRFANLDASHSVDELSSQARALRRTVSRPSSMARDDVEAYPVPPARPGDKITLKYTGLYCNEETDWDGLSNSDEPYVLTSVVEIASDGENKVHTERHPFSQASYQDVDTGNWRSGPIAACWHGSPTDISLISVLMEQDKGDPDYYKHELHLIVKAAAAYAASQGVPVPDFIQDLVVDSINWVLDPADDLIDTAYRTLSESRLRRAAALPTHMIRGTRKVYQWPNVVEKEDITDVPAHFETEHNGSGAHYVVGFEVTLQPGTEVVSIPFRAGDFTVVGRGLTPPR